MLANVWYPVNYFRLSFGKQDQLGKVVELLGKRARLEANTPKRTVLEVALAHVRQRDETSSAILSIGEYVPYRFLRPFFAQVLRGAKDWEVNRRIRQLADQAFNSPQPCLYRFVESPTKGIELHPDWHAYLQEHLAILEGFCLWHLVNYLQRNNPNVPNVANKLFEPQERDLSLAREFWTVAIRELRTVHCIYSGQPVPAKGFSLDHFLPWRFVAHDLLWNLVPTLKSINSSKSDSLPNPTYIEPLAKLQYQAVRAISQTKPAFRLLEDYIMLLKVSSVDELRAMDFDEFHRTLRSAIAPQMQIATGMGFSSGWRYERAVSSAQT
ncbi:MAG: hypothetical protein NZ693_00345 [Thermoflexales bacterium]|nr:hypothetical protein [Thermoflexales bacterium]